MRRMLFSVVLLLASSAAAVWADDAPEPFKALAGTWQRPLGGVTTSKDGKTDVVPTIAFYPNDHLGLTLLHGPRPEYHLDDKVFADRKNWSLVVGGGPIWSYHNIPSEQFVRFHLTAAGEKQRGLVASGGGKQWRFDYTLDDGLLTIKCKEPLPAGRFLEQLDISGHWEQTPTKYGDMRKSYERWLRLQHVGK